MIILLLIRFSSWDLWNWPNFCRERSSEYRPFHPADLSVNAGCLRQGQMVLCLTWLWILW